MRHSPSSGKPTPPTPLKKPPVGVLERGLSILECFREDRLKLALRDLAVLTGLDKATLLRLLAVLVKSRMLVRFEDGRYSPGPAPLHLGMLYRSAFDIGSRLQPAMQRIMEQTGETVAFYVRSGDERLCLYRANSANEVRHHVEIGKRITLRDGGSSAHVLRAFTDGRGAEDERIRRDGFMITREERVSQMASVAVPVFDGDGTFLGALVVIGLASRQSASAQRRAADIARRELAEQGFSCHAPGGARRAA